MILVARLRRAWCFFALQVALPCTAAGQERAWDPIQMERSPGWRSEHAVVYDSARGSLVLHGGKTLGGLAGDTWVWDGSVWNPYGGGGSPGYRRGHAMAYHGSLRRAVLFGGRGVRDDDFFDDTWVWRDGAWFPVGPMELTPPGRSDHAMGYDAGRNRTILFGGLRPRPGATAGTPSDDTWEWTGLGWEAKFPTEPPPARWGHAMAYDGVRGRVVLFGGVGETGLLDDFREWNGAAWSQIPMSATPAARSGHSMVWDPGRSRLVLFGGQGTAGVLDDTWEWDGAAWERVAVESQPPGRSEHAAAHDAGRGRVMLSGGETGGGLWNDLWEYPNPATYERVTVDVGEAARVALAWSDGVFAVVREVGTGAAPDHVLVLDRFDGAGSRLGTAVPLGSGYAPVLGGGEGRFGLAFQDVTGYLPRLYFLSFSAAGGHLGGPTLVKTMPTFDRVAEAGVAFGGGVFALVNDLSAPGAPGGGVELTRVRPDGTVLEPVVSVSGRAEDGLPAVVSSGGLFGVAWAGSDSVRFSLFGVDGTTRFPQDQRILGLPDCYAPADASDGPRILWTGTGFGFCLNPGCGNDILFATIRPDGVPRETAVRGRSARDGEAMGCAATVDAWGYAVADNESYPGHEDRMLTLWTFQSDGEITERGKRVTVSEGPGTSLDLEWSGDGYGLAWVAAGRAYVAFIRQGSAPPTPTATTTATPEVTGTPVPTAAVTVTRTATERPTDTVTASFTATPTITETPSPVPRRTPRPRKTKTPGPKRTPRPRIAVEWTPVLPDRNGDGAVDSQDLFLLAKEYGEGAAIRSDVVRLLGAFHRSVATESATPPGLRRPEEGLVYR